MSSLLRIALALLSLHLFAHCFTYAYVYNHGRLNNYLAIKKAIIPQHSLLTVMSKSKDAEVMHSDNKQSSSKATESYPSGTTVLQKIRLQFQSAGGRKLKLLLFAAIIARAFASQSTIDADYIWTGIVAATFATSLALRKVEDCYSYGYGASLLLLGMISVSGFWDSIAGGFVRGKSVTEVLNMSRGIGSLSVGICGVILHASSYIAYGLRMLYFARTREFSNAFNASDTAKRLQQAEAKVTLGRRVAVWISTAILLGLFYALPLHLHYRTVAKAITATPIITEGATTRVTLKASLPVWRSIISSVSSMIACAAVIIQLIADEQKLIHKEYFHAASMNASSNSTVGFGSDDTLPLHGMTALVNKNIKISPAQRSLPFCTSGLYSRWRHPNYAAEFVFHATVFLAAVPAWRSWHAVLLSLVGPLVFASIIRGATSSLEARQKEKYGGRQDLAYEEWVSRTRRFF